MRPFLLLALLYFAQRIATQQDSALEPDTEETGINLDADDADVPEPPVPPAQPPSAQGQQKQVSDFERLTANPNWIWLEELQIVSPLPTIKRFLGWYVDGEWTVQNKELVFLNFKGKSALMTNNLIVRGNELQFKIEFTVKQDMSEATKITSPVQNTEVLVMEFGNRMYDIKGFDASATIADLNGYALFFFRKDGKSLVVLHPIFEPNQYNLQLVFDINYQDDKSKYCEYDYLNVKTQLRVFFNFQRSAFQVFINEQMCMQYHVDERLFPTPKATFSFVGYSSKASPIQFTMDRLEIAKVPQLLGSAKPFHADTESIMRNIQTYDKNHSESTSLSNVLLIQGKSRKEVEKMVQLVTLLADRSKKIDEVMANVRQNENNVFYEKPIYREKLEVIVHQLEGFLEKNANMERAFKDLGQKFAEFQKVQNVTQGLEEVDNFVKSINSMLAVRKFNKLLKQIDKFTEFLDKNKISKLSIKADQISDSESQWEKIIKYVAIAIVILILILVGLIIKTINYAVKTHAF